MIQKYTGPWNKDVVTHLLKKTMFGAKKSDVTHFLAMNLDDAVEELLTLHIPSGTPIKNWDNSEYGIGDVDETVPFGSTWVNTTTADVTIKLFRRDSVRSWWLEKMILQNRSITEKMTLFLHNTIVSSCNVVVEPGFFYKQNILLRSYCLGNYKNLIKQINKDPAMLVYLNGNNNTNTAPDENYAREVMELFTLGQGSGYTEADVQAAARVLTGHRANKTNDQYFFDPAAHDTGNKVFSSFFNNTVITGRSGPDGALEADELIDMIFSKTLIVSRFICREIYRFFMYYDITPSVETNIINELADIFVANNWELKPVLTALFTSDHFFQATYRGAMVKSPIDFVVGAIRESECVLNPSEVQQHYFVMNALRKELTDMGQALGDPPDVSGWPAYRQIPNYYRIWANSDTYQRRIFFLETLNSYGFTFDGINWVRIDSIALANAISATPSDPNQIIRDFIDTMYNTDLQNVTVDQIKADTLLSGQISDSYWTNAWNQYIADPYNEIKYNTVNQRLHTLINYLFNLSEYQLI